MIREQMEANYPAKIYLEPSCTVNFDRRWSTQQFEKCSDEGCDDCNNNDGSYVLVRAKEQAAPDVERVCDYCAAATPGTFNSDFCQCAALTAVTPQSREADNE